MTLLCHKLLGATELSRSTESPASRHTKLISNQRVGHKNC